MQRDTGATLVHPYTDPRVIAGQGTAALELLNGDGALDARDRAGRRRRSGLGHGDRRRRRCRRRRVCSSPNPSGAAETFASLQRGERVTEFTPDTVCDGLRGTLGAPNFDLLRRYAVEALTVRRCRHRRRDAPALAARQAAGGTVVGDRARGRAAIIANVSPDSASASILSGGNVDLDALPALFALAAPLTTP